MLVRCFAGIVEVGKECLHFEHVKVLFCRMRFVDEVSLWDCIPHCFLFLRIYMYVYMYACCSIAKVREVRRPHLCEQTRFPIGICGQRNASRGSNRFAAIRSNHAFVSRPTHMYRRHIREPHVKLNVSDAIGQETLVPSLPQAWITLQDRCIVWTSSIQISLEWMRKKKEILALLVETTR